MKKMVALLIIVVMFAIVGCQSLHGKQEGDGPNHLKKSPCAFLWR